MTTYFLINHQDYFAAGFIVNDGVAYIDTTTSFSAAASVKRATATIAKAGLYAQTLAHPTPGSERTVLTDVERTQLTKQLDTQFQVISTENLQSC